MTTLQEKLLKLQELRKAQKADFDAHIDNMAAMPADVAERIGKRNTEIEEISNECKRLEDLEAMRSKNESGLDNFKHHAADADKAAATDAQTKSVKMLDEERRIKRLPRYKAVEHFKGDDAPVLAYRFANWFAASILKSALASKGIFDNALVAKADAYCKEFGIQVKAQAEGTNSLGGYLVPHEFGNDIIDLRETYGVFRQYAKVVPMMGDTKSVPRRVSGLTVYNPGEGSAITASDKTWDSVQLTARKFATLAVYSSELDEDSMINIGDDLAGEIAWAFANKEDECGFNGDATSTYFGITGVREKIKGLSGTIANIAGLVVGTGNAYSELVLGDFNKVVARLPQFADTPRAAWFVHKTFYHEVMEKLALAAGGVTSIEISNGMRQFRFLGYPVVVSQVMPKVEGNSQVCALLGDLSQAAMFGDRRQLSLAYSTDYKFAEDQLAIRGTQRVDINVHSVGNADGTAANRVAGPIVGLITAAS